MSYSCLFCKPFDGINVPLMFVDMTLWVGADETLRILKLSSQTLSCLPDCEKLYKHNSIRVAIAKMFYNSARCGTAL